MRILDQFCVRSPSGGYASQYNSHTVQSVSCCLFAKETADVRRRDYLNSNNNKKMNKINVGFDWVRKSAMNGRKIYRVRRYTL